MKNLLIVIVAFLLPIGVVQAQHMQPDPVIPGSKGPLPEMPTLEKAEDGHFGGLHLSHTTLSSFQGLNWSYDVEFSFPSPKTFGGDSYTLQMNRDGAWETYSESITGYSCIASVTGRTYRLVLHGGDKDGWVSNEVTVPVITIPSQKKYTEYNANQQTFVGSTLRGSSLTIYVYDDISNLRSYTSYKDDASFVRTWYRRNPNTGKMTYTGVSGLMYTVTSEDVGYEIVEVVEGDNKKTDFYYSLSMGVGKFPVFSSAEYFYEGIIVNTEYDIPNPETVFGFNVWNEESGGSEVQPFAPENFKMLAPGRYAIICPWERYGWEYMYSTNDMIGICENSGGSYISPLYLWAAPGMLESKALQSGKEVEGAKINLLEKNIEGNMQYVYTSPDGYLTAASYITLYAKAVNVGKGNLPTYYPNALLWTDAQSFDAQEMYHSEEGPQSIDIEVRPNFAPLSGQCTIDGKVAGTIPVPTPLLSEGAEAGDPTAEPVYVYLRVKGGDIVAATQLQADGSYHFGQVPYGTYEVIPNIDGYTVDIQTVTLSAENSVAKGIDYTIGNYSISASGASSIGNIIAVPADGVIYDLSGRRITNGNLKPGLYIRNGKKIIIGK